MASMSYQRAHAGLLVSGLLMTVLTLTGCGGEDKPAVCSDVDALGTSISALTDVKLEQGALPTLQSKFSQVQDDAAQLKTDATTEFGSEIDAVDSAAASVKSSLEAAAADTSAATVTAVGVALQTLTSALSDLQNAVESTC
jgi:hypothetical protein